MGVNRNFITAMKRAGYQFTHGHQTTLNSAMEWRAEFTGEFSSHAHTHEGWETLPKLIAASKSN